MTNILDRIWLFFSSVKLTIVLLLIFAVAMGYGTWIETVYSNGAARILIYRTWWFDLLTVILALNLIGCTLRRAPYSPHQYPWLLTHVSLLLIMTASMITNRFGMQGQMVILEGDTENRFGLEQLDLENWDTMIGEERTLPFGVHCVSFEQVMYPGTGMTSLFKSHVIVDDPGNPERIEWDVILNHPLSYKGYKISQASWIDLPDGRQATVLGVSYDPGIPYMYAGGILLVLSMVGIIFLKPWLKSKWPPVPRGDRMPLAENTEMTAELMAQSSDEKENVSA
ncbi:MAG: cytochrome c biogenesis protein ResB [bacterium]|nr:cytochrome c biogenesis protein ResB [bacterium]MBK8131159.1 cytochrome c biogenesis protein ResB [bacterium]